MVWNIYHTGNFTGYQRMVFVLLLVRPGHLAFVRNVTSVRRNTNMTKRGEFLQFLSVHRYTYSTGQLAFFHGQAEGSPKTSHPKYT